ncbi:MAG: cytochrome P450 [Novosphingobium sp.]
MGQATTIPGTALLHDQVLVDPSAFYDRLIAEAPVWQVGDSDVFTANSYAAVTEACRRTEDFSSNLRYFLYRDERGLPGRLLHRMAGVEGSNVLATADPPQHAAHKKIISPEFSPHRIAALEERLRTMTQTRLADGRKDDRIEFMSAVGNMIPIEVIIDMIAFSERNTEALFQTAIVQTDMLASAISREELERRVSFTDNTYLWVFEQLQAAMAAPGEGILGLLAAAMNAGEVDVPFAMAVLLTLFAAGGESTSSLIGNSVLLLAEDPALQARLRAQPNLIPRFIEESLRLQSPFRHHMRLVARDTELCGMHIPEGATLLMMWGSANRDPAAFEHPNQIDLDRPRKHVGFGSGIHVCLGNTLARLEARVVLETLLAGTREFTLDAASRPQWVPSLAVRRLDRLPLILS